MKYALPFFVIALLGACTTQTEEKVSTTTISSSNSKIYQDSIKEETMQAAGQYWLYSGERQQALDNGLAKDSTIANLWQQKAMPLFKQGKYELGMQYIDKAVKYDRASYQDYRAFIKCIFAKTYRAAIADFEDCKARYGNNYVMDHSYDFYIALSKIQLNEYTEAEQLLAAEVARQVADRGEEWVHHLDLFYLGIAQYEQGKNELALQAFDRALKLYPQFSEVLFYKGWILRKMGNKEEGQKLIAQARDYGKEGFTINEDNAIYERYPYQERWELWK